jgi:CBS domain containing-hemolysin-like protein
MDDVLLLLLVVGVVIVTSALCSLFEAVLYSVPLSHIENLAQAGRGSGRVLQQMRKRVDRPIAAILSLNTISNTAGAALSGALFSSIYGRHHLVFFSAAFTVAILVVAEVIPKTVGVVFNRPLSRVIAYPLQVLQWAFTPVIWLLQLVTRTISRRQDSHAVTDEEFMVLVGLGLRSGDLQAHEANVIRNILGLERRTAHEVMTPRTVVLAMPQSFTVEEARREKKLLNYSRIPVYTEDIDDVVGVVHRREVLGAVADNRLGVRLEELMHPVEFVLESTPLDHLLRQFLDRRQHMVVVIDEYGGLSGVVTLEDVLEEILGKEIVDEFDQVTDLRELAHKRRRATMRKENKKSSSEPKE